MKEKKKEKLEISGTVKSIVFRNEENGYTVFRLQTQQSNEEEVVCTGYFAQISQGELINISGNFVLHPSYGLQFKVESIEKKIVASDEGIEKYLASGIIKGVGPKISQRIVKKFGEKTFDIIENDWEKLCEVRGINKKLAQHINEVFKEINRSRDIMIYLQSLDITPAYVAKIQKRYGDDTINAIKLNPYRLTDDIWGIGFKKADLIAEKVGIEKDSPFRIKSAVKFCLKQAAELNGHVYLPEEILLQNVVELISVDVELVRENLRRMQMDNMIKREDFDAIRQRSQKNIPIEENVLAGNSSNNQENTSAGDIYFENDSDKEILSDEELFAQEQQNLAWQDMKNKIVPRKNIIVYATLFYYMEQFIAKKILLLGKNKLDLDENEVKDMIKDFTSRNNIQLAENQFEAVFQSVYNGVTIITGGPGTGKTTTLKVIIGILKLLGNYIELCAPTGRAAKKMSEATGFEAKTIHRLLGINFVDEDTQRFDCDENNPIKADYIVVDEASMIDIFLMHNLLRATAVDTKLILVGDVDQLPSVGPGNILKDFISSGQIKVVRLDKIFRQSGQSSITLNAHRINNGEQLNLNEKSDDFFFIHKSDSATIINTIVEMVSNRIPRKLNLNDVSDVQVLSPMKRGELGTINLNNVLQEKLNPASDFKNEKKFGLYMYREGDKIMQIKNNYSLEWKCFEGKICVSNGTGVFNGDTGIIEHIDNVSRTLTVKFDDNRFVDYAFEQLDEIDLAYAITIHKSQGSEYKSVVIPIFSGPPMLMNKNLLYTAVTRAKNLVVIIGLPQTVYSMIRNKKMAQRYSALDFRIKILGNVIKEPSLSS